MAEIPAAVAELITSEPLTAHIATCRDARPHVAPVWYLYDDGIVWIVTGGRKLDDIRVNPYVSLSIEKSERGLPEWTATLRGMAAVVNDSDTFERINERINQKYTGDGDTREDNTLVRVDLGSASYRIY